MPMPVTTPSAGRSSASQLASSASSTNTLSGSKSRAMRSRTGSLPCSASFCRARSVPPARARRRRASTSAAVWAPWGTGESPAAGGSGCGGASAIGGSSGGGGGDPLGVPDTGAVQLSGQGHAEVLAEALGDGAVGVEVDPGPCARRGAREQRVLAAHVAGGARRARAPPEAADGALEPSLARTVGGEHVGDSLPAGVVDVEREPLPPDHRGDLGAEVGDPLRLGDPAGVGDAH